MATPMELLGVLFSAPDPRGVRAFVLTYNRTNFDDTHLYVEDGPSNPVFSAAENTVHIEQAMVKCIGLAAGVTWQLSIECGATFVHGPRYTTTHASYDAQIVDLRLTLPANALRDPAAAYKRWLHLYGISGYAATDDMSVTVWGHMDGAPSTVVVGGIDVWPWKKGV